jgi:DNA-binding response OmpR family regulator
MNLPRILLLEDEAQLAKIVAETLQNRGYTVVHASNGRLGMEALRGTVAFDLCIVDVMMPFMDGFSFVKELRKTEKQVPVLFLTARSQDKDVVEGYESGGNDYLRKPFSLEELLLRIKELLQRSRYQGLQKTEPLLIGSYTHLPHRQELLHHASGSSTKLSHRENELLKLLIQHRNQLLDRKATLLKLWGEDNPYHARTMDVFITKLRKHLQADPSIEIINLRGRGYKLIC